MTTMIENLLTVAWALRFHLALIVLAGVGAFAAEALHGSGTR